MLVQPSLDIKEYKKEWNRLYRDEYREKLNGKDRKYYHDNKAKFSELLTCDCGCQVRRDGMTKHKATKKHEAMMNTKDPPL